MIEYDRRLFFLVRIWQHHLIPVSDSTEYPFWHEKEIYKVQPNNCITIDLTSNFLTFYGLFSLFTSRRKVYFVTKTVWNPSSVTDKAQADMCNSFLLKYESCEAELGFFRCLFIYLVVFIRSLLSDRDFR